MLHVAPGAPKALLVVGVALALGEEHGHLLNEQLDLLEGHDGHRVSTQQQWITHAVLHRPNVQFDLPDQAVQTLTELADVVLLLRLRIQDHSLLSKTV